MASKYYAVKVGLAPGIYQSWAECEAQVKGYPGALFKSFASEAEAAA
ncbi:MAG: RNase H1/viroplasmin domain-containing protein, partial [Lachnospiraceae bacterium]|nr:RNase H1/viroplasmin domain-containing protein [Lachnospiraceae bacterium]